MKHRIGLALLIIGSAGFFGTPGEELGTGLACFAMLVIGFIILVVTE